MTTTAKRFLLLLALPACNPVALGGGEETAAADAADSADSADEDSKSECPYEDAAGFYSGGVFSFAGDTLNIGPNRYPTMPTEGAATSMCITLRGETASFDWAWTEGSWLVWNDPTVGFTPARTTNCSLTELEFDCSRFTTFTPDGFPRAELTVHEGADGRWAGAKAFSGELVLATRCDGDDCAAFYATLGLDGYSSWPTASLTYSAALQD